MLKINKGLVNTIYATFEEVMQDGTNWILLSFWREINPDDKVNVILKNNISPFIPRVDAYNITEKEPPVDPYNGELELPHSGFWYYIAYEVPQDTDINNPLIIEELERGRCYVEGNDNNDQHPVYL